MKVIQIVADALVKIFRVCCNFKMCNCRSECCKSSCMVDKTENNEK